MMTSDANAPPRTLSPSRAETPSAPRTTGRDRRPSRPPVPARSPDTAAPEAASATPASATPTPSRRAPQKASRRRIRDDYGIMLQIGLALSLAVVLGLTQLQVTTDSALEVTLDEQEVVQMEEIQQTKQEVAPPPPPRPPAPVEVPNNAVVEQQDINFDASLDLNESLDVSGPPAPPPPPAPTDDAPAEEEIFVVVEEAPALIGGLAALQQKVRYPVTARRTGIEGRVIVQFIVDESGNVTEPVILRGRHPLLDEEALRVIQQAQFTPGRQRGVAVKVRMSLPIYFKLAKRSN